MLVKSCHRSCHAHPISTACAPLTRKARRRVGGKERHTLLYGAIQGDSSPRHWAGCEESGTAQRCCNGPKAALQSAATSVTRPSCSPREDYSAAPCCHPLLHAPSAHTGAIFYCCHCHPVTWFNRDYNCCAQQPPAHQLLPTASSWAEGGHSPAGRSAAAFLCSSCTTA